MENYLSHTICIDVDHRTLSLPQIKSDLATIQTKYIIFTRIVENGYYYVNQEVSAHL